METKDLVLLMLIPIILISLVIYTDKSPVITGAVTAEKEESNIIGTYSIMPSFKAKIDYDLKDYEAIKLILDEILKCVEVNGDIDYCTKEAEKQDSSFEWSLNCDKGAEKVLYDFAEFFQDCIDSEDNNCLCRKNLEIKKNDIQNHGLSDSQYRIVLTEESPKKIQISLISLKEPKIDLSYGINTFNIPIWYPNEYIIAYSKDELLTLELTFQDKFDKELKYRYAFPKQRDVIIYKSEKEGKKVIDFVKKENNNLKYPNDEFVIDSNKNPIGIASLDDCKPKNTFKFCVTKKNSNVIAYDKIDGKVKERNVTIKFASQIVIPPPPPLTGIAIYDRPKAEKSVLIMWDKSPAKNAAKYRIYYADNNLKIFDSAISTQELRKKVSLKEISSSEAALINEPVELTACEFDYQSKKCMFSAGGEKIAIDNEKLYFIDVGQGYYIYSLKLTENKNYDFTVTAIDKYNNEIDNMGKDQKLPVVKSKQSVDDLPPDSDKIVLLMIQTYDPLAKKVTFKFGDKPLKNIDGTTTNDFDSYKMFYFKSSKSQPLSAKEKTELASSIMESRLNVLQSSPEKIYYEQANSFSVDISSSSPESSNEYFFVPVALDKLENPKKELFKVKELGARIIQYTIP